MEFKDNLALSRRKWELRIAMLAAQILFFDRVLQISQFSYNSLCQPHKKVLLISCAIVAKYLIISLMRVSYEKVCISDPNCSPILLIFLSHGIYQHVTYVCRNWISTFTVLISSLELEQQ